MASNERFELEELVCVPDTNQNLRNLLHLVAEDPDCTEDRISNAIVGMIELEENKSNRMMALIEKLISDGNLK